MPVFEVLYPSGKVFAELTYKNNIPNGPHKRYNEYGKIIYETVYKDGKDINIKKSAIRKEEPISYYQKQYNALFKNGKKPEGKIKILYKNGTVMKELNFKNGKLDGIVKTFYDNGKLQFEQVYKEGKEISRKTFSEDGKLKSSQNFIKME